MSLAMVAWMASRPADPHAVAIVRGAIGVEVTLSALSLLFQSRLRLDDGVGHRGPLQAGACWSR